MEQIKQAYWKDETKSGDTIAIAQTNHSNINLIKFKVVAVNEAFKANFSKIRTIAIWRVKVR